MISYYELFNISSSEEIDTDRVKHVYRKYSMLLHPDRTNNSPESEYLMKIINTGYSFLLNPKDQYQRSSSTTPSPSRGPERTSYDNKPMLKTCPTCKAKLTMFDMVCPKCNEDLYGSRNYQKARILKDWFCPQCGSLNSKEKERCKCGAYKIMPYANAFYG